MVVTFRSADEWNDWRVASLSEFSMSKRTKMCRLRVTPLR